MTPAVPPAPSGDAAARRLLVLDDDPMIGLLIEAAARTSGFTTRATTQPDDFFATLAAWVPSHVVLDLTLPGTTGEEVLAELARLGCTARIILSSGVDSERLEACAAAGRASGLSLGTPLPKPFRVTALRASLE